MSTSEFLNLLYSIFINNWPIFLQGVKTTLLISLTGTIFGLAIGLLVGIIRTIPAPLNTGKRIALKVVNWLLNAYIAVFRGTPMIVQAMVIYFGSDMLWNISMSPLTAALIIVSINTGAYMAEVVRGGILSIDKGQFEAAQAVGMNHWQTMTEIIMPQVFRNILPAVGNEFVINVKDTSVLNVISVSELYFATSSVAGTNFRYFETFLVTAIIYFVLTYTITKVLQALERRLDGNVSYQLAAGNQQQVEIIEEGGTQ
ncbi:amino acid ABC transporter permease [Dolosicoccus paucivorans]|uniref:amino acid ABC transporter permease n=1 Tax=Dolosicoccus paucivorans TaxID=84521 RepID=UPI0008838A3B|nr:amino acid ABC transporter permease [Dolosicoccus paucivorans]SDI81939.1 amino acid ABC transporter membrane protein, PAAT family [Dolosicoccus paucivorans]